MNNQLLSLYEYLGKAAGEKLGKEVAEEAAKQRVGFGKKFVQNPKFTGDVMLYPRTFLDSYFKKPTLNPVSSNRDKVDDLPF